jgi:putative membrane protein
MRTAFSASAAVSCALLFAGLTLAQKSGEVGGQTSTASSERTSRSARADTQFVEKASQGGLAEVELGKLAQQKATNPAVKEFGRHMETDHQKANDELKSIASKEGMTVAASMNSKDQAFYDRLSKMSGAQFDDTYMRQMVRDHQTDIAEFQKEATSGSDESLKNFASMTLPTLRQHLKMAQDTSAQLGAKTTGQ